MIKTLNLKQQRLKKTRTTADFSLETKQFRTQWSTNTFKTRVLDPANISFKYRFKNLSQQGGPVHIAKTILDFYLQSNCKPLIDSIL